MPFCSQCGNPVSDAAVFCAGCGGRQPVDAPPAPAAGLLSGLPPRTASILCYVPWVGWIACVVVLAAGEFRRDRVVRFHVFQGLYLFVAYLVDVVALRPLDHLIFPFLPISRVLAVGLVAASILMMIRTAHGAVCSLPLIGDLAQRSAAEDWPGN
jgi:uncharacterized membrane protein